MEKILKTKVIFVSFLIADISLNLGDGCNYCECCKDCWGKKILEGEEKKVLEGEEWNKAVSSFSGDFSNDNFFENKYQNFNIFYDSVINKIKKKKFKEIKDLYNKKVQSIKDQLKCKTLTFNNKLECHICKETKNCAQIDGYNYCQECFPEYDLNTLKLPVCIPKFTLLKEGKYFVLKVSVVAIYVDEENNLFIRGDWEDEATYSDKFFEEKPENKLENPENKRENPENKLFKRISDDENFKNIYIYNYQKTEKSELKKEGAFNITNKSHLYFVLGEKDENTIFYNKEFNFVNCLNETSSNMNVFKQCMNVLNQTKDLYTSFAFCFHAVFYIIYSSLLYQIDPYCNNKSKKICPNSLHYYFDYKEEKSHSSIKELLDNKNLADIKDVVEARKSNKKIDKFTNYFWGLHKGMLYIPNDNLDKDRYAEIRKNSFTYSKNLLESIKTGFENS